MNGPTKPPATMLPPPSKEEMRRLRLAVKLYNTDLRDGLNAAQAARNWNDRGLWNGVGR